MRNKPSSYGKVLRKIRVDHDEAAKDMAKRLEMTPAYLSAIEAGKRNIPHFLTRLIVDVYKLNKSTEEDLYVAECENLDYVTIDLRDASELQRKVAIGLSRKLHKLNAKEIDIILKTITSVK